MLAKITLVSGCPPSEQIGWCVHRLFRILEEIHVDELNWQSNPESVTALAKLTGWHVTVVKGARHMLPQEYVGAVLEGWLS